MATQGTDLPGYEELINSLADKLDGLSVVHQGLGEAARSLVGAQRELADTKRGVDALTESNLGMLEEVRRLQPAELGATIDASLARAARDTSEGLGALSERLLAVAGETAKMRAGADAKFATLERQLADQDSALPERLGAVENSLASSLAAVQCEVIDSLSASQRAILDAVAALGERQDVLSGVVTDVQRQQVNLIQQVASLSQAIVGVRSVADTTQSSVLGVRHVADQLGPFVASALGGVRNDLLAESMKVRRVQLASAVIVLVALALVWAALEGQVPTS